MNPNTTTEYRDLPLAVLTESTTNPRRIFENAALKELADYVPRHIIGLLFRSSFCGGNSRETHRSRRCPFGSAHNGCTGSKAASVRNAVISRI